MLQFERSHTQHGLNRALSSKRRCYEQSMTPGKRRLQSDDRGTDRLSGDRKFEPLTMHPHMNWGASPTAVVMTATIEPAAAITESQRNDPAIRLNDYLGAFRHYLSLDDQVVDQIIILENSDADLAVFAELARRTGTRKAIRLINTSNDYPAERGKGYSEFLMMDAGLAYAVAAGHLQPQSTFWKVTGRLICANMTALIRSAPADYSVYCDLRSVPFIGDRLGGNNWMDLRIFSCRIDAYDRYFRSQYGVHRVLEKGFFQIIREAICTDPHIAPRFRVQPRIHGFGGFDNRNYRSPAYVMKEFLRDIARTAAPQLWL